MPIQHTQKVEVPADLFSERYSNLIDWIELWRDDYSTSLIRVSDNGGLVLVWEGGTRHKSIDE
ncbi:MAG: hypothetical protein U0Z75_01490 [Deinococcaceae bacterium]